MTICEWTRNMMMMMMMMMVVVMMMMMMMVMVVVVMMMVMMMMMLVMMMMMMVVVVVVVVVVTTIIMNKNRLIIVVIYDSMLYIIYIYIIWSITAQICDDTDADDEKEDDADDGDDEPKYSKDLNIRAWLQQLREPASTALCGHHVLRKGSDCIKSGRGRQTGWILEFAFKLDSHWNPYSIRNVSHYTLWPSICSEILVLPCFILKIISQLPFLPIFVVDFITVLSWSETFQDSHHQGFGPDWRWSLPRECPAHAGNGTHAGRAGHTGHTGPKNVKPTRYIQSDLVVKPPIKQINWSLFNAWFYWSKVFSFFLWCFGMWSKVRNCGAKLPVVCDPTCRQKMLQHVTTILRHSKCQHSSVSFCDLLHRTWRHPTAACSRGTSLECFLAWMVEASPFEEVK